MLLACVNLCVNHASEAQKMIFRASQASEKAGCYVPIPTLSR